jgi:hypothetical protein
MLVTSLGPAIKRREDAMSAATPMPRFVKLNADALLRMDPETRERLLIEQVKGRTRAPSEARGLADLEPFTPDQLAEFDRLFGKPKSTLTQQRRERSDGREVRGGGSCTRWACAVCR